MPSHLPKQLEAAIQAYTTAVPRRARLMDLAGAVLAAQSTALVPAPPAGDLEAATSLLAAGQPLLTALAVPAVAFRALLAQLLTVFQRFELLRPLPLATLEEILDQSPSVWLEEGGPISSLAAARRLPANLLFFFGQKALAPFYQQAAQPYDALWSQGLWQQPICPACGRPPTLALLTPESGRRRLHCRLCDLTWPAPSRQACVFCGTEASQGRYYFLEDDPARRADLCQACGRYLRTIVLAKLPHPLHLPLEEFVLVDLDTLMAQRSQG